MHYYHLEAMFNSMELSGKVEKPDKNDVHLLSVNRGVYDEQKSYSEYFLDKDEQNRAQRFRFRKNHDLFVLGRYITKMMLAYYTDRTPESVKITLDEFGKPASALNLFFNISHSDDQLLLGFSNLEIGVDIEKNDPKVDVEEISISHFSMAEFRRIMDCSQDETTETFFEIWTKKESLIKGIGKGLRMPLQGFSVTSPNGEVLWELLPSQKDYGNWYVQNIEIKNGFKAAFATRNLVSDVSLYMLQGQGELSKELL